METPLLAPVHEPGDGAVVGLSGVGVTDGDGEEVDERQAVRSSAVAIIGGSRSANAASGPAGVLWTSCWVMESPVLGGIRESYKKTIITTFMKGFI